MELIEISDFNNHKIKEFEIIKRIIGGEKELYEILVRRNNQKLYRVIRTYLKDEAEIKDAMQESYLKAYLKLYQFNAKASFSTWLIRIGINEALARLKEKGKLFYISKQFNKTDENRILEIPDKNQLNPQDRMIKGEAKLLLENAIDQLDIKYRTVYLLKEVEEMNLKEIASTLDLSVANVKVRIHRSKDMLKEKLYELSNDKNVFEFGAVKCDNITETIMKLIH